MDLVSVIIPTYNRSKLLPRAIKSVQRQNYSPLEIILVDDGSKDNTKELIETDYPEIRYMHQENLGISAARNLGISAAKGEWISFLDSDDEWLPDKLGKQINALADHPELKICHTNEIWIRNGKRVNPKNIHKKYGGEIYDKCLPLCIISPSAVIMHKEIFQDFGFFDTDLAACEDYDMWLRICAYLPVLYLPKPLINKYGGHEDQLSQKYWGMDRFRIQALEKMIGDKNLDRKKTIMTLKMLLYKINIYITGAKKRKKNTEIKSYTKKYNLYHQILEKY